MPVEHLMQSTIFATPNLMVRYVGGFSTDKLVITFYHYANARSTNVSGFGEEFFLRRNIDAVHFIPAQNNWYQYDELPHAAALVRKIAEQYRKVVTYGSSMGGYAAIRFGRAVGASEALALSPQFSIDPLVTPFEQRWAPHSARISFALERSWREQFVPRAYVVYDPYDRDRRHVEMFRGETAVIDIRVLNGGHPTIWLLADLGLLEAIIFDVLHDQLDPKAIQQSVRAARGRAPGSIFCWRRNHARTGAGCSWRSGRMRWRPETRVSRWDTPSRWPGSGARRTQCESAGRLCRLPHRMLTFSTLQPSFTSGSANSKRRRRSCTG